MKKMVSTLFVFLVVLKIGYAQTPTQTLRGKVVDKTSQMPLAGAVVRIDGLSPVRINRTDADGVFRFDHVPVGRYNIVSSYVGYASVALAEVLVGSGKECVLLVELVESVNKMEEVVVKAHVNKDKPLNALSTVSARSFNVEEARRYAGGMDDPARLASAFAGVTMGGNMQDNAITIRGNSPKGVLWQIEGVEVPNPNHFSGGNVAGGGFVSVISSQVLSNSDFFTGAFPAEYGNALAGVFDIKLRTGNNEKCEYAIQAGIMGLDFSAEGPLVKGKKASFLFNYRYSTFGLLSNLGMIPTEQIPIYQDLSFKLNFPTSKAGVFSVWGIGGIDEMHEPEEVDSTLWETEWDRYTNRWNEAFGAIGVNHKYRLSAQSYLHTSLAASGDARLLDQKRLDDHLVLQKDMYLKSNTGKITLSTYLNNKVNARMSLRTGLIINKLFYGLYLSGTANDVPGTYQNYVNENGNSTHFQASTQTKYHLSDRVVVNAGVHVEYFALTQHATADPRIGLSWDFQPNQSISFGYGKHSQLEDLNLYFIQKSEATYPNKKLDFAHAQHFILAYDWRINESLRLKVEPYFQYLYEVPGIADSSFSMINYKQDLTFRESLVNNSKGRNIGMDVTFEQFLKHNFYYLVTASVFDSRYKGGDGIWRHARYDKDFVVNVLCGKEFLVGENKRNSWGLNGKLNVVGGERSTPLLEQESQLAKRAIYDESRAFDVKEKSSAFLDLSVYYRVNRSRYSSIWSFQMKNVLGTVQYGKYEYNYLQQALVREKAVYAMPSISYKVEL
jgi:hypothetical protein